MEIYCVKEVEQNPLPNSQTKPFYIGTKEAPSEKYNQLFVYRLAILSQKTAYKNRLKRQSFHFISFPINVFFMQFMLLAMQIKPYTDYCTK